MKYFIVKIDKQFIHAPSIINWFEKINVDLFCKEREQEIPKDIVLKMKSDPECEQTDIISHPVFAVSELVKEVLSLYEPNTIWEEMMLYSTKDQNACLYFIPILDDIDCVDESSVAKNQLVLNEALIRDKSIFQVEYTGKNHIIMRLDLVESLLRRDAKGIQLTEVLVVNHV